MLLVGAGANINATDASNKTPMFCLLANGDFHVIVQWMLASGADTTITGEFLDQRTGKTRLGTVLSQATKYTRLESATIMLQITVSKDAIKQALKVAESREVTLRNKDMDEKQSEAQRKALDRLLLIKSMLEERLNKDVATHRKRTSFFQFINSSFRKEKPATVTIQ
jgi:ankyrin repeat protein